MRRQQAAAEQGADQSLHAVGRQTQADAALERARPLDQQAFVLAAHRPCGPVGPDRRQAEQGVQVEAVQGAGVIAHAQVPLV